MTALSNDSARFYGGKLLCQIVGLACLAGFLIDFSIMLIPPAIDNLEWRIGILKQLSDRAIILLFGLALLLYGVLDQRRWRKRLSFTCLGLGLLLSLLSLLVIHDGIALQNQTLQAINTQASQIQSKIDAVKQNPQSAPKVTAEQLEQAAQALNSRKGVLQQNTRTALIKNSVGSVGNLVVIGLALIGLGQYGARLSRL
jgi:predicted PurR-regulated permease PerM